MQDRELRRLSRQNLLELLVQQKQQNEMLQAKVSELEALLNNRSIQIENAGSMAEAALALNGVFESADKAAAQFLDNIKRCSEQQKNDYDKTVAAAEQKAKAILDHAERESQQKIKAADEYWQNLITRLEAFYQQDTALREHLSFQSNTNTSEKEEMNKSSNGLPSLPQLEVELEREAENLKRRSAQKEQMECDRMIEEDQEKAATIIKGPETTHA